LQDLNVNKGSGPMAYYLLHLRLQNHYLFFLTDILQERFSRQVEGFIRYSDIEKR
jgi:hypothetical protein